MSKLSDLFSDLRTYLDVMAKAGLTQWKTGTIFDVTKQISPVPTSFNQILHDTFASYLASPEHISFNNLTQR